MADEKHLAILLQNVEQWNQWRKDNPDIQPDLNKVELIGADLRGVDFREAKLYRADLSEADLTDANFSCATMSEAILRKANLTGANFTRTNLQEVLVSEAVFCNANLTGADLSESTFIKVNLHNANLRRANLRGTNLFGVNLREVNLREADLQETNLNEADLREADLRRANLSGADLIGANLTGADIREACLHGTQLIRVKLDSANLTKACLWETSRAGWSIKGVICESIYWDEKMEDLTVYSSGDFERLYKEKVRVRLFYKDGITPLEINMLHPLINYLEDSHQGCRLRFMHLYEESGGAIVELAIEDADDQSEDQLKQLKAEIEVTSKRAIEFERKLLSEEKQRYMLESRLNELRFWFKEQLLLSASPKQINVQGDSYMGDKYNVSGHASSLGETVFNQPVYQLEQSIDLAALATELSELRQAITKTQDLSPQAAIASGELAKAEFAAQEKDSSQVIEHLKVAGKWTLDYAREIGKDLAVEALKRSMGMP